jgi:deoxycytidylate deaminase
MKKSLLHTALVLAKGSLGNHPQFEHFPHWTFLVLDNQIVSTGVNRNSEPSRRFGYHNLKDTPTYRPKWHSELDAIYGCNRHLHGCVAINVRLSRLGEPRMAFPCKTCRKILKVIRCTKVFFTTDDGFEIYQP